MNSCTIFIFQIRKYNFPKSSALSKLESSNLQRPFASVSELKRNINLENRWDMAGVKNPLTENMHKDEACSRNPTSEYINGDLTGKQVAKGVASISYWGYSLLYWTSH